jgi:hypothetical protein
MGEKTGKGAFAPFLSFRFVVLFHLTNANRDRLGALDQTKYFQALTGNFLRFPDPKQQRGEKDHNEDTASNP